MIDRELRAPWARGDSLNASPSTGGSSSPASPSRLLGRQASSIEGQSRNSARGSRRGALSVLSPANGPMGGGSTFVEVAVKSRPAP